MLFLLILLASILLALCFIGLGVRVFFHRSHQFPDTEVGHNPQMQQRGIVCPHSGEDVGLGRDQRAPEGTCRHRQPHSCDEYSTAPDGLGRQGRFFLPECLG